jgi:hypothetical protein
MPASQIIQPTHAAEPLPWKLSIEPTHSAARLRQSLVNQHLRP